jgi:ubiquinone/menaquinone biosynthesis C-methylase UbiE
MGQKHERLQRYWNNDLYSKDHAIWGHNPSMAAEYLVEELKSIFRTPKLLDLGCGYGRNSIFFSVNGCDVVGVDFSEAAITDARSYATHTSISYFVGDIFNLPFDESNFDVVFCNFVIHWYTLDEIKECLDEIYRVLIPGGILCLGIPKFLETLEHADNDIIFQYKNTILSKSHLSELLGDYKKVRLKEATEQHTHGSEHLHELLIVLAYK